MQHAFKKDDVILTEQKHGVDKLLLNLKENKQP